MATRIRKNAIMRVLLLILTIVSSKFLLGFSTNSSPHVDFFETTIRIVDTLPKNNKIDFTENFNGILIDAGRVIQTDKSAYLQKINKDSIKSVTLFRRVPFDSIVKYGSVARNGMLIIERKVGTR